MPEKIGTGPLICSYCNQGGFHRLGRHEYYCSQRMIRQRDSKISDEGFVAEKQEVVIVKQERMIPFDPDRKFFGRDFAGE